MEKARVTCGGALLGVAVVIGSNWLHVKGGTERLPGGSNPACSSTLLLHDTTRNRSMTVMMLMIR